MKKDDNILPDKPLVNPENDRLGYAPFAKHLATSVVEMAQTEGLVIALNGPWGSGKTTITNFIEFYFSQLPVKKRPVVMHFNPWWFSGDENLVRRFFNELRLTIEKEIIDNEELNNKFSDLVDAFSDYYPDLPWQARLFIRLFFKKKKEVDIQELKNSVAKSLGDQKKKIIVIIDDIDRLTAEEIRQIFKLIKAVADFPNIIYLLSFDKKVAIKSLESIQKISGEDYLEKIVQAAFDVPLPDKALLYALLFEKLNIIFIDRPDEEFDQTRWQEIFFEGVEKFISTPRNVTRLYNTIAITYPAVKDEVNPVDFIAIETLRIFSSKIYEIIRLNPTEFTDEVRSTSYSDNDEMKELRAFHDVWMKDLSDLDKKIVHTILPVLFPKIARLFKTSRGGYEDDAKWRVDKRICHPEIFPIYFGFVVSPNKISAAEVKAIIELTSSPKLFSSKLISLTKEKLFDKTSRLRHMLEVLRDYAISVIPEENIPNVIKTFFSVGDKLLLPEDEKQGMFEFNNDILIGRVLWPLLKRQGKDKNLKDLKEAIKNGDALSTMSREIAVMGQQQGKMESNADPESEWFVNSTQLVELEKLVLIKIRKYAKEGKLLNTAKLYSVLYRWKDWAEDPQEVRKWVKTIIRTDKNFLLFLAKSLGKSYSYGSSGTKIKYRLDPKGLENFIAVDSIIERVKKLSKMKNLPGEQKIALDTLLKEYALRKEGKDPDNPLSDL